MEFQINQSGDTATVSLEGQLNFSSNEKFESLLDKLVKLKPGKVVFNLAGLSQIDSVGLGLLYIAQEDLTGAGASLALSSPREAVLRLLELTEAHKTFTILSA